MSVIYLANPSYSKAEPENTRSVLSATTKHTTITNNNGTSALCYTFNMAWCDMLNRREGEKIDYFAMLHSDIGVLEINWLDKMVEILESGLNTQKILSVVSPLKDMRGLCSTGLWDLGKDRMVRRLVIKELDKLPSVFGSDDVCELFEKDKLEHILAVNTGCMLIKVGRWCERLFFRTEDGVIIKNNKFEPTFKSEDWLFSRDAFLNCGIESIATTEIKIEHLGRFGFTNYGGWGELEKDNFEG